MPTAFDIAASQYQLPNSTSRLRYSCHARHLLPFFVLHRTALASHVQRSLPEQFKSDRLARLHLQSLASAQTIRILTYNDPRRPNVYMITDDGIDHAADFMRVLPESIPSRRDDPNGDHILHELLITEVAVARAEFLRSHSDFEALWDERFGFFRIPSFASLIPDYAQLYRCPHGLQLDFIEVLTGERSISRIQQKMEQYAAWSATPEAEDFLLTLYRHFGAKNPKPEFRLHFIAHNRNLIGADAGWERQILNATFNVPERIQRRIWTTTNAALSRAANIDDPVWHCGVNLVHHRSQWLDVTKRQRAKWLSRILAETPTHPVFTFE